VPKKKNEKEGQHQIFSARGKRGENGCIVLGASRLKRKIEKDDQEKESTIS